jgi:uncharacterized protein YacL
MSSIIATTIGPAGVVFLVPAFFEFLRAKPERTLLGAIIVISVIRSKLIAEGKKYQQVIQKRSFKIYLFYFLALIIGLLVGFILGHYGFSQMLRIK